MSGYVVVHIAVDSWRGTDLTSSVLGAWSTPGEVLGETSPTDLLDHVRAALGAAWRPATVAEITEWHEAFKARADVPWEQISLF